MRSYQDALAHAAAPISMPSSTPRQSVRSRRSSPTRRRAGRRRTGAKFSAWPKPSFSTSTRCRVPTSPSSHAALRARAGLAQPAGALLGDRRAGPGACGRPGVPRLGEKGKMWPITMSHSSIRRSAVLVHRLGLGREAGDQVGADRDLRPLRLQPRDRLDRVGAADAAASSASGPCRRRPGSSYGGAA